MLSLSNRVEKLTKTKVTGLGLSVFRIFFSLILLVEVGKLFYFRHLYFDPVPYIVEAELSVSLVLLFWLAVLVFGLLIGFKTRVAAVINYVLVLVFFSSFTTLKYHFDSALIGLSFLLIIIPISTRLSLDSLWYKLKNVEETEQKVRQVYYYLPVVLILGLQYFDSFFHKVASDFWLKGLGFWLPASLPHQVYLNISGLLNQEVIIKILGYAVLLFELSFLGLLLVKKLRVWVVFLGVLMHVGIAFVFPIPTFGITYAGVYLLLLPLSIWKGKVNKKAAVPATKPILIYSKQQIFSVRFKIFIKHFDVFKTIKYEPVEAGRMAVEFIRVADLDRMFGKQAALKAFSTTKLLFPVYLLTKIKWFAVGGTWLLNSVPSLTARQSNKMLPVKVKAIIFYLFFAYIGLGQIVRLLNAPALIQAAPYARITPVVSLLKTIFYPVAVINSKLFGITENQIYTSFAEGTVELLGVEYLTDAGAKIWLPLTEKNGIAAPLYFGRVGNIIRTREDSQLVYQKLIKVTSFWAYKNNISLQRAIFNIVSKPISIKYIWEENYLNKQIKSPWQQAGTLTWQQKQAILRFNEY